MNIPPTPRDIHRQPVRELAARGKWVGLIRYFTVHQYPEALQLAQQLIQQQAAQEHGRWQALAESMERLVSEPFAIEKHGFDPGAWAGEEQAAVELLQLFPRLSPWEMLSQVPAEQRGQYFQATTPVAQRIVALARHLHDTA